MGRRRWLDEEAVEAALKLVVEGATFRDASEETGLSERGIRYRFKLSGLVRRRRARRGRPGPSKEAVTAALAAVARGALIKEAAAANGIVASTLSRRVAAHGVVMVRNGNVDWTR